ncbi:MAG: hypothetical protein WCK58_01110 [Chloroflexota bacterium]
MTHTRLRRVAAPALLALALALVVAACGGPASPSSASAPASSTAAGAAVSSPIDGVLVAISAEGLAAVKGFTLRLNDGREIVFKIGVLENGAQFPPGHLAEHMATSTPVRVSFRDEAAEHVAYRLEDAPAP